MKDKNNHRWMNIMIAVLLATSMLISFGPRAAQAQEPIQSSDSPYLIPIPLPDLHAVDLPAGLERDQAGQVTEQLLAKEAIKLLDELRALKDRGLVSRFEVLPDSPAIRVMMARENAPEVLQNLPGETNLLAEEAAGVPACIMSGAERLPEIVLAASRAQDRRDLQSPADPSALAVTTPSIEIFFFEGPNYNYGEVWGFAAPRSEVRFRLLRGGKQVAVDYQWSGDGGDYYFQPEYYFCLRTDNWSLQAGDVVEISAGGSTTSTTVTPIRGWINAENNTAMGVTSPNQTVKVTLFQLNRAAPCDTQIFTQTGVADGTGKFSIDLSSKVNFDRSASAEIHSVDAKGNSTFSYTQAYKLMVYPNGEYIISLQPQTSFTLVLKRGEVTIETVSDIIDEYGRSYRASLTNAVQQGDQATLSFDGGKLSYTVVDWPSISVDRSTGQVTGSAAPGLVLRALKDSETYTVTPRCSGTYACVGQTVPASGQFTLNLGQVLNGDIVMVTFFTPEGQGWGYDFFEPSIEANPAYDEVYIRWWDTQNLTVTLKDSAEVVKDSYTFNSGYWSINFWVGFNADMLPGDRIEVSDGINTRSMTVSDLAGVRINFNTDRITGTAGAGHLVSDAFSGAPLCVEKDHAGGTFDLDPGVDILGGTYAKLSVRGSDGYYTFSSANSLHLSIRINDTYVWGGAETTGAIVDWTHKRDGATIDSGSTTSNANGYFDFSSIVAFQTGDILLITTNDGNNATVTYPEMTIQLEPAAQRAFGRALASQRMGVSIFRVMPDFSYGISIDGWADAAGDYSLHFPPDFWWMDCKPLDMNGACQNVRGYTTLANGFTAMFMGVYPPPAAPDAFENDNSWGAARSYVSPQMHTLDNRQDEDWVMFSITEADVTNATPFHLIVSNAGLFMDLNLELYSATDFSTPIATAWGQYDPRGGTQPPKLAYTFSQAGTYYLRIHSKGSDQDGGYCTSQYTLVILRNPQIVALPLIRR